MTSRNLMGFISLFFIMIGTITFWDPQNMYEILGFQNATLGGFNETRANYGGMMLGIGIFLASSLKEPKKLQQAWFLLLLLCGGLTVGRVWSIVVDGWPQTLHNFALGVELLTALISAWMWRKG